MDLVICSECGAEMPRIENGKDLSLEEKPKCNVCRGVPGAKPFVRKRDILGGFPWKRDAQGRRVPK